MEVKRQKRVAAVHDISCFGKCSLTVALPVISAAGAECSVIPTAILSTHTGGFTGFTYRDLTEDIAPIANHWRSLGLQFDAIYTGFLGSFEQVAVVRDMIDMLKTEGGGTTILVDPVMADNGEMYSVFTPDFAAEMAKLCSFADIIVPNITEACFMLGMPYSPPPYSREFITTLLAMLSAELSVQKVVLTGVCFDEKELGAACFDAETARAHFVMSERIGGSYHGTGDVFGSALLGALMNDFTLEEAVRAAVDFTVDSIRRTAAAGTDVRFGVNFEESLPGYMSTISAHIK